jgi:hypothetical protein
MPCRDSRYRIQGIIHPSTAGWLQYGLATWNGLWQLPGMPAAHVAAPVASKSTSTEDKVSNRTSLPTHCLHHKARHGGAPVGPVRQPLSHRHKQLHGRRTSNCATSTGVQSGVSKCVVGLARIRPCFLVEYWLNARLWLRLTTRCVEGTYPRRRGLRLVVQSEPGRLGVVQMAQCAS